MNIATPADVLILILLGGLLGAFGQGMRVVVGLKKMYDQANRQNAEFTAQFSSSKLMISLFIGFLAGGIGILTMEQPKLGKELYLTLLGIGYAGADFIEGFVKKSLPGGAAQAAAGERHPNNDTI